MSQGFVVLYIKKQVVLVKTLITHQNKTLLLYFLQA